MRDKKRLIIIILICYILIYIGLSIYHNNQKYIIIDSDYVYKITNDGLKPIKKYPNVFKDTEMTYYELGKENKGYIHLKDSKILFFNEKLKKIIPNIYTITSINNKKMKVNYLSDELVNEEDLEIISEYLEDNGIDSENYYEFIKKVKVDINNNKGNSEYLYIVSNHYKEEDLTTSYMKTNDDAFEVAFVYDNNNYYTLFERTGEDTDYYSVLSSVFDYNNDGVFEIVFMDYSIKNHYHFCSQVYTFNNSDFSNIENCGN